MNDRTSCGTARLSVSAFICRIARRVSRSGGWMSVMRPHSNRVRSRSSSVGIFFGRPVRGDHDLALRVERVERVEELLLGPLLAFEELDVVDEQEVAVAVAAVELGIVRRLQRDDEVVHELLGGDVANTEPGLHSRDVAADRVEEVGLAEPGASVDEERVVGVGRRLRDGERGGVREAVGRADHEGVEGVFGMEVAAASTVGRELSAADGSRGT